MLLDANYASEAPDDLSAAFVIIGAGTVGLFVAAALAEMQPRRDVILVESGPKVASTAFNRLTSESIGKPHGGVHLGRAAGLGGTSALWGGQLAEFDRSDLEREGSAWPLSYEELRKYYGVVYQRLSIGHPESAAFYRRQLGTELDEPAAVERFFTYWLQEPNFARLYKRLIQGDPAVRIIVNLTANGMEFDGETAASVRCTSATGRSLSIRAQRFIFASGTVAISRFFLSTQRQGRVPWSSNPQVGRYFQDHFGGKIAKVSIWNERRFRDYFENGWVRGVKLQPKLTFSAARRQSLPSSACGYFTFDSSISQNLANIKRTVRGLRSGLSFSSLSSRIGDAFAVGGSMLPLVARYMQNRRIFAIFDRGIHFNVQAEQIPIAESKITLRDASCSADGLIPVAVDWKCDGREIAAIRELAIECDAYLRGRGIAELAIDPCLIRGESTFIDELSDTYHQCGGMRMSTTPRTGVVDADCRVWGTDNVWVVGAAVLPSSSHANCTLTALAMAARLARSLH
jgi:hypothetical protein